MTARTALVVASLALAGCATVGAPSADSLLRARLQSAPRDASLPQRAQDLVVALELQATADPQLAAALHAEVATMGRLVAADVAGAGSPLASEARAKPYAALLAMPQLADVAAAIRAQIGDAGRATCESLDASTPYASWLAATYCAHFGVTRTALALPDRFGSVVVDGDVASDDDRDATASALDAALAASPWFAPDAPALHATVRGDVSAEFAAHPVTRTVRWTEDETYTGSLQTWNSVDPIELHREKPRTFSYAAVEHVGTYSSQLHVDVEPLGIGASESAAFAHSGDDTDVQNDEASVTPSRAELPTLAHFWAVERATLADHLRTELARAFHERACTGASYEAAAECAYVDPSAAAPALAAAFGGDAPLLALLLGH
ncbi:MAG TPA: hypothetical protein VGG74_10505 [Kofleriaceae bacterium]|jgi:hypothetical protein